jgi:hypothetical protein
MAGEHWGTLLVRTDQFMGAPADVQGKRMRELAEKKRLPADDINGPLAQTWCGWREYKESVTVWLILPIWKL